MQSKLASWKFLTGKTLREGSDDPGPTGGHGVALHDALAGPGRAWRLFPHGASGPQIVRRDACPLQVTRMSWGNGPSSRGRSAILRCRRAAAADHLSLRLFHRQPAVDRDQPGRRHPADGLVAGAFPDRRRLRGGGGCHDNRLDGGLRPRRPAARPAPVAIVVAVDRRVGRDRARAIRPALAQFRRRVLFQDRVLGDRRSALRALLHLHDQPHCRLCGAHYPSRHRLYVGWHDRLQRQQPWPDHHFDGGFFHP